MTKKYKPRENPNLNYSIATVAEIFEHFKVSHRAVVYEARIKYAAFSDIGMKISEAYVMLKRWSYLEDGGNFSFEAFDLDEIADYLREKDVRRSAIKSNIERFVKSGKQDVAEKIAKAEYILLEERCKARRNHSYERNAQVGVFVTGECE